MAITDDHFDISERDDQQPRPAAGGWNRPLVLAGLGLVLMLGGYAALNYVPLSPKQTQQDRQLDELRDLAAKQPTDAALSERLNHVAPPWRAPPFELPGRLAVYAGLFLFVVAGVMMYRHSPPKETPREDD
jgi:hypothetical protein